MGVLSDEPSSDGGDWNEREGAKFVRMFWEDMDDDDRAMIRKWDADPDIPTHEITVRIRSHYPVGRSTIVRGLETLRKQWAS